MRLTIDFGVDLGTTNSEIALWEGNRVDVIKNNELSEFTPSAIYEKRIRKQDIKYVGMRAKDQLPLKNEWKNVSTEFKRKMGVKDWHFKFSSTGRKATAPELSSEVLKELIKSVKQRKGEDLHAALITVPAAFMNPQYEDTKKAGYRAGLLYVELLEEPVAAALAYSLKAEVSGKVRWLAYDLGGGTFDAALVEIEEGVIKVIGHEGDNNLGGKDIDAAIIKEYLLPALPKKIKDKVKPQESGYWWKLKVAAENAKVELSTTDKSIIEIDFPDEGYDFVDTLTREQLDKIMEPVVSRSVDKCKMLLARHKFTSKNIEKVILIGGPTLSLYLREEIEKELGIPLDFSEDPITAVAKGAAIYAKGRKIRKEGLKKIAEITGDGEEARVDVELHYPPTTIDREPMVTGKLESREGPSPSVEWRVEINRVDKEGKIDWTSGKIPVAENGAFARNVKLVEGENNFRLVVMDPQGRQVETYPKKFSITLSPIETPGQSLARGLGVATEDNDVVWFFEAGRSLPCEKSLPFKTTKMLTRGKKEEALNIPVVEGRDGKAYLNWHIGTLEVTVDRVLTDIPKGAKIEVTLRVDESRSIYVSAFLEDYDVEVESKILGNLEMPDPSELQDEQKRLKENIELLKQIEGEDEDNYRRIKEIEDSGKMKEVEKLISQTSDVNCEPGQQAKERIMELRRLIDPVLEKLDELLFWQARGKDCDENVQKAKNLVREIGALPSDEQKEFDNLLKKYKEAVERKDTKGMFKIAFEDIPGLPTVIKYAEPMGKLRASERGKRGKKLDSTLERLG